jgi:hypothetical protein
MKVSHDLVFWRDVETVHIVKIAKCLDVTTAQQYVNGMIGV